MLSKKQFLRLKDMRKWTPYIEKQELDFRTGRRKLVVSFKEANSLYTKINPDEAGKFGVR